MKNRTSRQNMIKLLALALAMVLTLGNLPMVSFADGGGAEEPKYNFDAQIYFTVGEKRDNGRHAYGTFWPGWNDAIKGKIYSDTYDFANLETNQNSHFYIGDSDFDTIFSLNKHRFNIGTQEDTGYFERGRISEKNFFEKYILPQINARVTDDKPFKMKDHNENDVILDPNTLFEQGCSLMFFRYAHPSRPDNKPNGEKDFFNKIHLDIFIDRPDAGDITIINMKPGVEAPDEKVFKDKIGRVVNLDKEGYIEQDYTRFVEIWNEQAQQYEPYDEKAKPIIFGKTEQKFKIRYAKSAIRVFELENGKINGKEVIEEDIKANKVSPTKFFSAEIGSKYEFTPAPKENMTIKSVSLDGEEVSGNTVTINKATKEGHIIIVRYISNTNNNGGGNNGGGNNGGNNNGNNGNAGNNNGGGNNGGGIGGVGGDNGGGYGGYQPYESQSKDTSGDTVIEENETPLGTLNTEDFIAYIQGYPDGSVRPDAYVNRQETAAIFFRLLEPKYRETVRSTANDFKDVNENNWSNKHISTLAKGGILNGYATGDFRPADAITRAELAAIAAKFDKLENTASHNFTDIKGHWAEKYIANASAKGWIKGYPNGEFKPDTPITRAEFVTFVNKVLGRSVKKSEVLPGVKTFTDLTADAWYYEAMVTATNSYNAIKGDDGYQKWTELINPVIEM